MEKGTTEDKMVGWHHWLNGHGFGWTPGVGDGQGGLACCGSWSRKELDMTERLNWTEPCPHSCQMSLVLIIHLPENHSSHWILVFWSTFSFLLWLTAILFPTWGFLSSGPSLSSVQFSCSVVSDSLQPHELQHSRPPCPSPTPRACSNSCLSSRWCHLTISSSVTHFSCLQSFPVSRSFLMSQFFASGGQSIGASASVLPMNIQDWSPLGWTGWFSLQSKGLSRVFSNTTVQKHHFFGAQLSL